MLEMLLNLQPQNLSKGKMQESGEKQAEKLLGELGLGEVSEVKDFLSLLKGEQEALSEKGLEEAKQVALELAQSGKEAASEMGLKVLAQLSRSQGDEGTQLDDTTAELLAKNPNTDVLESEVLPTQKEKTQAATLSSLLVKSPEAQGDAASKTSTQKSEAHKPTTLVEKLWPKSALNETKTSAQEDQILKDISRLKSHGPELTQKSNIKSQGHIRPGFMSAEDFLGQKQLKSADPEVAGQNLKSEVNAQMLQKYENGQKVVDRQIISFNKPSGLQATGEGTKTPLETEADISNTDSSKLLKEVGVMKAPEAPRAAGMEAKTIDIGKNNTLDLSKMDMSKPQQVIDKIVEYIDKAQFERTQKLDILVKHEKLGQFQMQVSKSGANSELIDLKIQAQGSELHNFFKEHELDLMKTLSKNGVRLGDFKLTQGPESSSFSQSSDSHKDSQSGQGQKFSQGQDQDKDQADRDSQRRKTLWQQYQERYGA